MLLFYHHSMFWFLGIFVSVGSVISDPGKCGLKLLNDYEKIPDSAFNATSYYTHLDSNKKDADFSPKAARESYDKDNQDFAWCPLNEVETSLSEFLEIDLGRLTMIKVVQTKGRFAQGAGKEFTPFYRIRYLREGYSDWRDYKKFKDKQPQDILKGPSDAFLDAFETLDPVLVARKIRIFPYSQNPRRVCLKLQLFGCDFSNDVIEYRTNQGSSLSDADSILNTRLSNLHSLATPFFDNSYDGDKFDNQLQGGLGILMDNNTGASITNDSSEVFNYMGWKQSAYSIDYVSITFVFLNKRNFTSVRVYSYQSSLLKMEYFSKIEIAFSDDGHSFDKKLIEDDLKNKFDAVHYFIDFNISGRSGKFVRLQLYFQTHWLLISEITFTSKPTNFEVPFRPDKHGKVFANRTSIDNSQKNVRYKNMSTVKPQDKTVSMEIIYLLSILLCLFLGIIFAICSFWIILRKRAKRRRNIKKQAMALCSHNSLIPYNFSSSVQCLSSSLAPGVLPSMNSYTTYTVDRRQYPNGTLRNVSNVKGCYTSPLSSSDNCGFIGKQNNTDSNIYTSIVGSDNDSSLSPEYATTSVTNDPAVCQPYSDTPSSYLPPPLEPMKSQFCNNPHEYDTDTHSLNYPQLNTISTLQDANILKHWRQSGHHISINDIMISPPTQLSFNDYTQDISKTDQPKTLFGIQNSFSNCADFPRTYSFF